MAQELFVILLYYYENIWFYGLFQELSTSKHHSEVVLQ